MSKVAIITGGASGFGLAIATALSQHPSTTWQVHILDLNPTLGHSTAQRINAAFHPTDVLNYTSLSTTFHKIYNLSSRIDFVFANAGIIEPLNYHAGNSDSTPPPPPNTTVLDVNLKAVVTTSWLALHYFRLTRDALKHGTSTWEGNLVMTASVGGIYPVFDRPMYAATKHGVVGFTRSLARKAALQNVRVNCVCPGLVHTGMTEGLGLPVEMFTPMEGVVKAVLMLIEGEGGTDEDGVSVRKGEMFGRAVEVFMGGFWFREAPAPVEAMKPLLGW